MRALLLLVLVLLVVGCRGGKPAAASEPSPESRVTFPSFDGGLTGGAPTRLDAVLFRPRGKGPFPAVVLLHGCGGLFKAGTAGEIVARDREWALRLQELGYVAILPDSFNPRGVA